MSELKTQSQTMENAGGPHVEAPTPPMGAEQHVTAVEEPEKALVRELDDIGAAAEGATALHSELPTQTPTAETNEEKEPESRGRWGKIFSLFQKEKKGAK